MLSPKVYLAELIRHFFPGRDLAPPRPVGRRDAASSKRTAARGKIDPTTADDVGGGKQRPSFFDHTRGKGKGGFKGAGSTFAGATHNFPSVVQNLNLSSKISAARRAAMNLSAVPRRSRSRQGTGGGGGEGTSVEAACQDMPQQKTETVTPATNLGVLLQHATREVGEEKKTGAGGLYENELETQEEKRERKEGDERQPLSPAVHTDSSRFDEDFAGETVKPKVVPSVAESSLSPPRSRASLDHASTDDNVTSHRQPQQNDHQRGSAASLAAHPKSNASEISSAVSFIGDNFSTTQLHQRGSITVYVPHSPNPGVWAACVEYDGDRDVSWVLTEALRMYNREHSPVGRHAGLARRPRLVQRPCSTGLQQEPALSPGSPVVSVLRPGEELVVLVEGFDPVAAFSTRPSVVASPPTRSGGGATFAGCEADGSELVSSERSGLPSWLPRPPPAESRRVGSGTTPTREEDVSGTSRARGPTDGPRRFAGIDESMGVHGGFNSSRTGEMNACGDGSGVGRGYAHNVVAKGGRAPGTTGAEERLRTRFGGFGGVGTTRNREANSHEEERSSSLDEDFNDDDDDDGDDDDDDDDSLTAEEDDEEGDGEYQYHHRNPWYGQGGASNPQGGGEGGRGGGGGAWLERHNSYGSPPRSRNDVSATTRGLAERCEDDSETEGDRTTANGERRRDHWQTGQGFPEPRSPPRSLVLEMFSAWRRG